MLICRDEARQNRLYSRSATWPDESVRALVEAGMDVARMNFSHGDYTDHKASYERVRAASDSTGRAVGHLADLQGPKIRLGRFADGPTYWATGNVRITVAECPGNHDRVVDHLQAVGPRRVPGDRVLVDDGNICLMVEHIDGDDVVCTVPEGGTVSNNKGISLPGMSVSAPASSRRTSRILCSRCIWAWTWWRSRLCARPPMSSWSTR